MQVCVCFFLILAYNHLILSSSAVLAESRHLTNPGIFNLWALFLIKLNKNVTIWKPAVQIFSVLGAHALLLCDLFNVLICHSAGEVPNARAGVGSARSKCVATFVPADL